MNYFGAARVRFFQVTVLASAIMFVIGWWRSPEPIATIKGCTGVVLAVLSLVLGELATWRRL